MENANLWLLTREQLSGTQSSHIDGAIEQSYRKQDANFIRERGVSLNLPLLPINADSEYTYSFYMARCYEHQTGM
ncbi:hypothetical protein TNIN_424791 [Trichonephila inaurata madagascariensis]|uniref:Uncharacterized protein n=1 Tax=Trichonephila inaurata madagascariensis TaxID=2747483 RepID=A0A8X7BP23_9ARAC|nr:hypothetical protein TNIN_424791 [Trichonephila inaurata madagascariensis]